MSVGEKFVNVHREAEILGFAPNAIRAWEAAGKIPEYRRPLNNYQHHAPENLEQVLEDIEESMATDSPRRKNR
jgi:hypothetical protein